MLYLDLSTHRTAPLWRNEPVDDGSIRILIDACIRVLKPWSQVIPSAKSEVSRMLLLLVNPPSILTYSTCR